MNPLDILWIVLSLLAALLWSAALRQIARHHGEDPALFGMLGFLIGPFALPFVLARRRRRLRP